jgi:UDP-N-acetylmuramoyl-L-alanyl-D-glutamate--2,6-diaminopimelate ligase
MVEDGATHAVLEVTSHGLAQHRVAGCDFDVAAVTNITHEHLDFHGTLTAYQEAKRSLFEGLKHSLRKPGTPKTAVLNGDDDSFRDLRLICVDHRFIYGVEGGTGRLAAPLNELASKSTGIVTARNALFAPDLTRFSLHTPGGEVEIETPLIGTYNVSNVLAAASVGLALGIELDAIHRGVAAVRGIPGRMERIDEGQSFLAIVDFAHTPNALQRALEAARGMAAEGRQVLAIFGCAGLRDRTKREMMGRVAGRLADRVIVTAEDPRTEDLDEIVSESVAAATAAGKLEDVDLWRVLDRGEALLLACQLARAGDVVIACGKGHEQSMCFGSTEYAWDDRVAMRRAIHGDTLDTLPTARRQSR